LTFPSPGPPRDCLLCPRLAAFREVQRADHPEWFNAPVPSFGDERAELLIVGLAPGLRGANRTGRPFTGDHAGTLLYDTLRKFGFAGGVYDARPDDGLVLHRARITNAVRCVPPQNKPQPAEIATCRRFLAGELAAADQMRAILALGAVAHASEIGERERAAYERQTPRRQRSWLAGRIAAKDAVRDLLWKRGSGPLFPVEVEIDNEPSGRRLVDDDLAE